MNHKLLGSGVLVPVLEHDLDGNAKAPEGSRLYSERFIHAEVYRARPDVNAVVHNHAPSLIPFGATGVPLRPLPSKDPWGLPMSSCWPSSMSRMK